MKTITMTCGCGKSGKVEIADVAKEDFCIDCDCGRTQTLTVEEQNELPDGSRVEEIVDEAAGENAMEEYCGVCNDPLAPENENDGTHKDCARALKY